MAKQPNQWQAAFDRWKDGAPFRDLVAELGCPRHQLRKELTRIAGGREQFHAMRATGAGGQLALFGGKRAPGGARPKAVVALDDSKVRVIHAAPFKKGWKLERLYASGLSHDVYVAPDGTKYIRALGTEPADLIYDPAPKVKGLAPMRLRKLESSAIGRRARRQAKVVAKGEVAIQKSRASKRAKKIRRKR